MKLLRAKNARGGAAFGRGAARWFKAAAWIASIAVLLGLAGWLALPWVPLPRALFDPPPAHLEFTDLNGQPLRAVRSGERPFGQPVSFAEIPQALIQATLSAEDKRFWQHPGVDWRASLRAAWGLVRHGRVVSGGSTVTQQLIKLAEPRPRTFRTKLVEAVQALRLEQVWDKQRILAEYLNRLDYGNLNVGCAAAADFYCGKPLRDLSPAECALLAGLPQSPTRLNPFRHWDQARKRQQWVLGRMRQDGLLTQAQLDRAIAEVLRFKAPRRVFEAPHFVDLLLQQSSEDSFRQAAVSGEVRTTLVLELNRFVEQTLRQHVGQLQAQHVSDAAAVIIDNRTGGVRAMVGSCDYFAPGVGQVNGAWAPRSAGSTFKPFTYLIAFEQGATPATAVADVPTEFATATGVFAPVNYDRHCYGPMRYRLALANSLNIPAVKVLAAIGGPAPLQKRLQASGLTTLTDSPEHYGLGLTIGNAEARLLELANAYACLARLGEFKPYALLESGTPAPRAGTRVFDSAASYLIADILSDNAARTLAFGAESSLSFDFPVACKTGTSSDFRDNWAFGYTPEFTVGVWVGNFDGSPMQEISGVTGAAPILHDLIEHLHQRFGTTWYQSPANIVERQIHPITGKQFDAFLDPERVSVREKFIANHLPAVTAIEDFDVSGKIRLPAEYAPWLATGDNWLAGRAVVAGRMADLRIVFPLPGTTFYLDPDLPDSGRRIHLQAEGGAMAEWRSGTLSFAQDRGQTFALLDKGRHQLTVRDLQSGVERKTWIEVLER